MRVGLEFESFDHESQELTQFTTVGNYYSVGWNGSLAMQTYSDQFRAYRKVMHRVLGTKTTTARFNSLQEVEVRRFLMRVLDRPEDLVQHIRT